jgi:hypothetical protein
VKKYKSLCIDENLQPCSLKYQNIHVVVGAWNHETRLTGTSLMRQFMTRTDHQILYTALAFVAVYLKAPDEVHIAEPATILARHIEEYCRKNIETAFRPVSVHFVNETDVMEIDRAIERHIDELRQNELTILPQDKETLLKFYDRLQQRKSRRMQAAFYEMTTAEFLANAVLKYIDEEIEDAKEDI